MKRLVLGVCVSANVEEGAGCRITSRVLGTYREGGLVHCIVSDKVWLSFSILLFYIDQGVTHGSRSIKVSVDGDLSTLCVATSH
jgi:hypothetical protein